MLNPLPANSPADATGYYGNWQAYYPAGIIKVVIFQRGMLLQGIQRANADFTPRGTVRFQIQLPSLVGLGIIEREDIELWSGHITTPLNCTLTGIKISVIDNNLLNIHYRTGNIILLEREQST